jgi:hypothetical protein
LKNSQSTQRQVKATSAHGLRTAFSEDAEGQNLLLSVEVDNDLGVDLSR